MTVQGGKLVTIFGGSGFIGTQLVQDLARRGYRIRVAVRRPDLAGHVRMYGFPGQIQPVQANLRFPESVQAAVRGADIVVNLVGILFEKGRQNYRAVHVAGAKTVAETARAAGATRLIHMSAIGADAASPSAYQRTKALGEAEVAKGFPEAIVIKPSLVFGPDDDFFNTFGFIARLSPFMPLIGGESRLQPVYVGDVASAIAAAVDGAGKPGKAYELGGPEVETMRQLLTRVMAETQRPRTLVPVPAPLASALATLIAVLPRPMLTPDQVIQLGLDNLVSPDAIRQKRTLAAFGITPTSMNAVLPSYLWRFRRNGEFDRQASAQG